jgi:2-phospho-L-lactate/phosphoenolpyruvate guanylyltransferase
VDAVDDSWVVLVPVKTLAEAKTRLVGASGRADLALAFACDTIAAAASVARVAVVSDDPVVASAARDAGAEVLPQGPEPGLNSALRHAAGDVQRRDPHARVAVLAGDLPALRADEVSVALNAAAGHLRAFVCDAEGTGTTFLAAAAGVELDPRFGTRSRAAHRASGAVELRLAGVAGLRRDVDDEVGLWDARRLGVGPRTRAALDRTHG